MVTETGNSDDETADARRESRRGRSPRRELVEAEIYEQAARLFAERGFAGTTPQDIAEAVGVSRQALYYYVKSKDEILARLVSKMTVDSVTGMRDIVATGTDPRDTLRRLANSIVTERARDRTRFRLLDRSESALPEDLAQEYLQGRRTVLEIMISVIEIGIDTGHFRVTDPRVAALSVIGMCNWVAWWFEPGTNHPVEPIAAQISANAVAMLAAPAAGESSRHDPAAIIESIAAQLDRLKRLI